MRTACGQFASLIPRGEPDGYVFDKALGKHRLRKPEEKVWVRTLKERNGQITITYSDPIPLYASSNRQRMRMGEVNTAGPGLCKICNWTAPDDEIELRRWKAQHIDGIMDRR